MKADFPRVYRQTRGYRGSMYVSGIIVVVAALVGAAYTFAMEDQASGVPAMLAILCGLCAIGGAAMIASGARTRVVLHEDAIEVFGVYRESRLARSEILGLRLLPGDQGGAIRLMPRYTSGTALSLPPSLAVDDAFHAWFEGFDNLDMQDQQASIDRYLKEDSEPGSTEEKWQRMRSAARVVQVLNWLTLAAVLWAIFYPHPYRLAIVTLTVLPWVAVALAAFRGSVYRLDVKRNEVGVNVGIAMIMPGLALMLRAALDVQVLDWLRAAILTGGGAIACSVFIYFLVHEERERLGSQLTSLLMMCAYSFGVVMLANNQLDHSEPVTYPVEVLAKRISTDKSATRYLELEPWGPRKEPEEVEVGDDMYEAAAVGGQVCVYMFSGALGMRWYETWNCPHK